MKRFANKLSGKKKIEDSPVAVATKSFIKGTGDQGLSSLPTILDACSVTSPNGLGATIEVLDLITHYFAQKSQLNRQARCVDLLRYLSDSNEIELFPLVSQNLTFLELLERNAMAMTNTEASTSPQSARHLESMTRILIDHFCLKQDVPQQISALQQKLNVDVTRARRSTQAGRPLTEAERAVQEVKRVQFEEENQAAMAECELMSLILSQTDGSNDTQKANLDEELYESLIRRRETLAKLAESRLTEEQTMQLVNTSEQIETTLQLYSDYKAAERKSVSNGKQKDTTWQGLDTFGTAPTLSYSAPSPIEQSKNANEAWSANKGNYNDSSLRQGFTSHQTGFLDAASDDGAPGSSRSSARDYPLEESAATSPLATPDADHSTQTVPKSEWSPRSNNPFNTNPFLRQQPPARTNPFL